MVWSTHFDVGFGLHVSDAPDVLVCSSIFVDEANYCSTLAEDIIRPDRATISSPVSYALSRDARRKA